LNRIHVKACFRPRPSKTWICSGRAADCQKALDFGTQEFADLDNDALEDVGGVDLVFDVTAGISRTARCDAA
jgi:hypothetical protein